MFFMFGEIPILDLEKFLFFSLVKFEFWTLSFFHVFHVW